MDEGSPTPQVPQPMRAAQAPAGFTNLIPGKLIMLYWLKISMWYCEDMLEPEYQLITGLMQQPGFPQQPGLLQTGLLQAGLMQAARDARLQSACFVEAIMWPSSTFTWVWLQYHKSARIVPWLVGLLVFGVRWLSWRFEVRIRYKCQVFKQFYYVGFFF